MTTWFLLWCLPLCAGGSAWSWDYAVINYGTDFGTSTGWLGYGYTCGSVSSAIATHGYPGNYRPGCRKGAVLPFMYLEASALVQN
jgi:hypothetical protein